MIGASKKDGVVKNEGTKVTDSDDTWHCGKRRWLYSMTV